MKKFTLILSFSALALLPLFSQAKYVKQQKIYQVMETDTMPTYKGGYMALLSYIDSTFVFPKIYEDASIQGRVICRFVVEPDGSISSIELIRGIDKYLDEEVIRVLKLMPKWLPGKRNEIAVAVEYYLPVICRPK
jgi:TonB family protein